MTYAVRRGLEEGMWPRSVHSVNDQDRAAVAKARRRPAVVTAAKVQTGANRGTQGKALLDGST